MSNTSFFINNNNSFLPHKEFTQITEISNDGFNSLYRAKRNGKWWLLKTLKKELQEDIMYQSLLMKEFDLMTSLQHPYIVQVHSIEDIKGIGKAIIMEWVNGVTLDKWLSKSHSVNERRNITNMLIETLKYLHSLQIQHRDLKPQNIMVINGGTYIKLIDFGLSDSSGYAVFKQPVGSEGYVAPEGPDDIFSLGCLLQDLRTKGFASFVINRCCCEKQRRYKSIDEVDQMLNLCWKLPKYIFTIVFVTLVFTTYFFINIESSQQNILPKVEAIGESVNKTIEENRDKEEFISSFISGMKSKTDSIVKANDYENVALSLNNPGLVTPIKDELLNTLLSNIKNLPAEISNIQRNQIYEEVSIYIIDNYIMRWINDITNKIISSENFKQGVIKSEENKKREEYISSISTVLKGKIDLIVNNGDFENKIQSFDNVSEVIPIMNQLQDSISVIIKDIPTDITEDEQSNIYGEVSTYLKMNYITEWMNIVYSK